MQTRKSIQELAAIVVENSERKADYIVPSEMMKMTETKMLEFGEMSYTVGDVAHEQLAAKLDIPKKYYDRMKENSPELLSHNVNTWLSMERDKKIVRTLGEKARAVLSDRYRPFDNDTVLGAVLPIVMQHNDYKVISSELTERRMYMCVVSDRLRGEVKKGEVVQQGIIIGNSEVGQGSFFVDPMIYILSCLNGAVLQRTLKKYHVGRRIDGEDFSVYQHKTIMADQKAFLLKVEDVVSNAFNELNFRKLLGTINVTTENQIVRDDIQSVVEDVTKKFDISIGEKNVVLKNLIKGGDLTQWGMSQAVTAVANDLDDYDRAVDLQRIGGKIIDLTPKEWHTLSA